MNYIGQIIEFIQRFFIWFVSIMPWERAVHVRAGKRMRILSEGIHFRIPFIDRVYVQTTKLRVLQCAPQTVETKDGKTITIVMAIGYTIIDIEQLFMTLFQPEMTLTNMVQGAVADVVVSCSMEYLNASHIEEAVEKELDASDYGLDFEYVKVVNFAQVRAIRLIQEGHWISDSLEINKAKP